MNLGPLRPGDVIRYADLWADERAFGLEDGCKDRPAVVLALSVINEAGRARVLVVAVTHAPPRNPEDAVPFPIEIKRRIRLDDRPAWIVTTEGNAFSWPGPDLRPIPGHRPRTVVYGRIPSALLRRIAASYLANRARQRSGLVERDE